MSNAGRERSLRHVAMDYLARRDHSELELRRKLLKREVDAAEVEDVLQQLKSERLQSDERFAEAYVHHRAAAGIGPLKIRYELRQKGVADALIDACLEPLADAWDEAMRLQRERKYGMEVPNDYSARMKQARFLQNRGFSPESVMRLFR